jgi:hypothetical protein
MATPKITLAGSLDSVEGTEHFTTIEECQAWLDENQVHYPEGHEDRPATDSVKYILYITDEEE